MTNEDKLAGMTPETVIIDESTDHNAAAEDAAHARYLQDIKDIQEAMVSIRPYRVNLQGKPYSKPERAKRAWYNGQLITQAEFDTKTHEEQAASQRIVKVYKK